MVESNHLEQKFKDDDLDPNELFSVSGSDSEEEKEDPPKQQSEE